MCLALVGSGSHSLCSLSHSLFRLLALLKGEVCVCEQGSNALSFFSFTSFSLSSQYPCTFGIVSITQVEQPPHFPPIQHRQLQASTPYHASTSMMGCVFGLVIDVAHSVTKKSLEWDRW